VHCDARPRSSIPTTTSTSTATPSTPTTVTMAATVTMAVTAAVPVATRVAAASTSPAATDYCRATGRDPRSTLHQLHVQQAGHYSDVSRQAGGQAGAWSQDQFLQGVGRVRDQGAHGQSLGWVIVHTATGRRGRKD
jgi:hypothetical protein